MKVGILGSGVVGQQLGLGFLKLGYEVKIGTRSPEKLKDWLVQTQGKASVGNFQQTAEFGEILIIATLWTGTESAVKLAGEKNFSGKIVIDATNPLDFSNGVPPKFISTPGHSGGEQIQSWLPSAKVVKAFNTISAMIMCNPQRNEGVPDLFIAGNDSEAKKFVAKLASQWGWASTIDMGSISQSFLLEAFAMLWISYGFTHNNWTHSFKLLRK